MRVLTGVKLPDEEKEFFELMALYFPRVYDVKYLMKSCKNLKGGLQEVAESLEVCVCVWGGGGGGSLEVCVCVCRRGPGVLGCVHTQLYGSFTVNVPLHQLKRVGTQHQAGSDSYLTGAAFFKMKHVSQSHTHSTSTLTTPTNP